MPRPTPRAALPEPDYLPFERRRLHRCTARSVYFMQSEGGGRIKIGSSNDPERRLQEALTHSATPLRIVGVIRDAIEGLEGELHARFAYARRHLEWFEPVPELVRFIRNLGGAL